MTELITPNLTCKIKIAFGFWFVKRTSHGQNERRNTYFPKQERTGHLIQMSQVQQQRNYIIPTTTICDGNTINMYNQNIPPS